MGTLPRDAGGREASDAADRSAIGDDGRDDGAIYLGPLSTRAAHTIVDAVHTASLGLDLGISASVGIAVSTGAVPGAALAVSQSSLEARVVGTGKDGGPSCGTVKPFEGWQPGGST